MLRSSGYQCDLAFEHTVNYTLFDLEAALYKTVTEYVKTEMGKADELEGPRICNVGWRPAPRPSISPSSDADLPLLFSTPADRCPHRRLDTLPQGRLLGSQCRTQVVP
jgi:hypothetical protein